VGGIPRTLDKSRHLSPACQLSQGNESRTRVGRWHSNFFSGNRIIASGRGPSPSPRPPSIPRAREPRLGDFAYIDRSALLCGFSGGWGEGMEKGSSMPAVWPPTTYRHGHPGTTSPCKQYERDAMDIPVRLGLKHRSPRRPGGGQRSPSAGRGQGARGIGGLALAAQRPWFKAEFLAARAGWGHLSP
jgi:hypothetical protein